MQVLIEPLLRKGSVKLIKSIYSVPSYLPTPVEFENHCLISVAPIVCVSHAFVYEIIAVSSIKLPSLHLCASNCRAKTIPWLICQSMVNTVRQIPTL